jgi:cold shock protein
MVSRMIASVGQWNEEKGWGVVWAEQIPEGIWVHFSAVEMEGFKTLEPGERIEIDVEGPLPFEQDGFRYRARSLRPLY